MGRRFSLVIAGVGGQGGLTLSRVIASAAVKRGMSVRTGETLGMSQRGGSVQSYVKLGEHVVSPLIERGGADALIGLEPLEAARASPYLSKSTLAVLDPTPRPTIFHLTGREKYPDVRELLSFLESRVGSLHLVEARREAEKLGAPRSANMILLGKLLALKEFLPLDAVEEAVEEVLGRRAEGALKALKRGLEL